MKNILYKPWKRIITILGDIMLATRPPKTRAVHIRDMLALIEEGDIILRKYLYHLDNYYIPNEYTHSGIVIDKFTMVHAVIEGVSYIDPIDFIKDCDGFMIIKRENGKKISEFAKSKVGLPYDVWIDKKSKDAFYCHELSHDAIIYAGGSVESGKIILANDLIKGSTIKYEF